MTAHKLPQKVLEAGPKVSIMPRANDPVSVFVDSRAAVGVALVPCEGRLGGMPGAGLIVSRCGKAQPDMLALKAYGGVPPMRN